jgi:integrase
VVLRRAFKKKLIKENPMPVDPPPKGEKRERWLNDDELAAFWRAAVQQKEPWRSALKVLALRAQRNGEVTGMRRSFSTAGNERHLLACDPTTVEAVLAHGRRGIAAVCDRSQHVSAWREVLDRWAAHVERIVGGGRPRRPVGGP